MKEGNKLTKKILFEDYNRQPFEWLTEEYGLAGFTLCPIIRRNKIREVHLYPAQQPNAKYYYVIQNPDGWEGIFFGVLLIESNGESNIQQPIISETQLYKLDKTHSFSFSVPRGAKSFYITSGLGKFCLNWQ